MTTLESFYDLPAVLQPKPDDETLSGSSVHLFPQDKLPYENGSGQYFNYIIDWRTGSFEYLSRGFAELTGYNDTFFKQGFECWQHMIHPADREAVMKSISRNLETWMGINIQEINQYSDSCNFRVRTKKGDLCNILRQRVYFVTDSFGNIIFEAGMFLDITRFRRDGNLSLLIHGPDGSRIVEYYPKEDAAPRIAIVRNEISEINRLAGMTGNAFIRKALTILAGQYADKALNVKKFGELLHISRSQLYRQLEKTTGICPNRLIRLYRLHQSLEHLARNELTISETAWRVGFGNPSWFAQCFYQEFGCTPSDYRHLMR